MIALVIVGHLIEPWIQSVYGLKVLYIFIYSFHMPAFVLIAGYFAKFTKDYSAKGLQYLGLFFLFTLLYWPISGKGILANLITPYWVLWFLVSLILWYVLLQLFVKLKHPILISLLVAILAGYINQIGYIASLSRTLVFFPFFLSGYYFNKDAFNLLPKAKAIAIIAIAFSAFMFLGKYIDHRWFYGSFPYSSLGHPEWYAGIFRTGFYTLASIMIISFLSLVPTAKRFYTFIGRHTLYIFLFHGLIIKVLYRYWF